VVLLDVSLLSPRQELFQGTARSVIAPGEEGVFEVLPFHKRLLTRLIAGVLFIDETSYRFKRGILKVNQNQVTIIIEGAQRIHES